MSLVFGRLQQHAERVHKPVLARQAERQAARLLRTAGAQHGEVAAGGVDIQKRTVAVGIEPVQGVRRDQHGAVFPHASLRPARIAREPQRPIEANRQHRHRIAMRAQRKRRTDEERARRPQHQQRGARTVRF
jgi:hypothetical protein